MISLQLSIFKQELIVFNKGQPVKTYAVSTAKNGPGEKQGSEQTPRGLHIIRAKIGNGAPENTVFVGRRPTGEIYTEELGLRYPERDWILTRILWLSGLEIGKNRLKDVDSMRRYIYIHGTPDKIPMGLPQSRGCIRMRNHDILELFNFVPYASKIDIDE